MNDKTEILCYGDSNTFGTVARWSDDDPDRMRYGRDVRWPCVMQSLLGDKYFVTEEGLSGRTTIYDPEEGQGWNGERLLLPVLSAHRPLDLVIIMLGTNDLHLSVPLEERALGIGIGRLADIVLAHPELGRNGRSPEVLIAAPARIRRALPGGRQSVYAKFYGEYGEVLSSRFGAAYRRAADLRGCHFIDSAAFAESDGADGVHFTARAHARLGRAMAEKVKRIFEGQNGGNDLSMV